MGSLPDLQPERLHQAGARTSTYNALFGPNAGDPLVNRAIQSAGRPGRRSSRSPRPRRSRAGSGALATTFDDTGQYCFSGQCRHNAGDAVDGALDLVNAIQVSVGRLLLQPRCADQLATHPNGGALQHWARLYGIGQKTGIDLPGEVSGNAADAGVARQRNELEAECDSATGPFRYTNGVTTASTSSGLAPKPKHPPGGCGIADGTDRPWSVGDNENLAVGQGDVQVTPLQLAVVYSALANGGTVVTPHLGLDVQTRRRARAASVQPGAEAPHQHRPAVPRHDPRGPARGAPRSRAEPRTTCSGNFPEQVYGKTGTAQYNGQQDYAWYACFVPPSATSKPIVVVVTVEQGGFGAVGAAPVARADPVAVVLRQAAASTSPGPRQTL